MKTPTAFLADTVRLRAALADGRDRRSTGRADEVAAEVRAHPEGFGALFSLMFDEDAIVRMRAADAIEKVTVHAPELLRPWKATFLARLPEIGQAEVRWHAALLLPRLELTPDERRNVGMPVLRSYLNDRSRIVQTFALQSLADLAVDDPVLQCEALALAEAGLHTGSPALKVRCRRILARWQPVRRLA